MKKILILTCSILLTVIATISCGIFNKTTTVTTTSNLKTLFTSEPSGATVIFEGKTIGTTPCVINMPLIITASTNADKNSYNTTTNAKYWNMQFIKNGFVENISVDPLSLNVQNNQYIYNYKFNQASYINDPTIIAGEAKTMVSRDNPGMTALESTIIRWYFDSEPRGCRVFWRVVSSIPQIVKNTNEQYLGSTPYEETRSFNILGLTYENSRDVQIEIKIKKNGYMDQVKRFNVRQAIDQQEISSFFDMVQND